MATLLTEGFGSKAGTTASKFQAYAGIRYSDSNDTQGYYIQIRRYLLFSPGSGYGGATGFGGTTFTRNWGSSFSVSGNGTGDGSSKIYGDSGWVNVGWVAPGDSYSLTATCGYTSSSGTSYSSTKTVSITVPVTKYTLTMAVSPSGAGTTSPSVGSHTYNANTDVTISATASSGYKFKSWSIQGIPNAATSSSTVIPMTSDYSACAVFEEDITYYSIYYYYEGGSSLFGSNTNIEEGTYTSITTSYPSKTGYTFLGWATSSSSSTVSYTSGESFYIYSNLYLYPVYSQNTYTISYNANGGSGAPSSQTKYYGTALTLSSTIPTRSGYTFLGWSTSSTATSATYAAGGSYTNNSSATLYAVWQATDYTVSYDANGGSGAPAAQTAAVGESMTLSTSVPTKTGYSFLGWSTSSTATNATYQPGETFTSSSSVTLYAVWKILTYNVIFNANSGSSAPSKQTKTYDVDLTLSSSTPVRTGHTFQGWGTSASATEIAYAPGATYTENAHLTLYAIWKANTWTVSYDANGGSGAPAAQTKTYGVVLTLSGTKPTWTGYIFEGWGTTADDTTPDYQPGSSYSNNATITLYAIWSVDSGAPGVPTNISATYQSDTAIALSWTNNPHAMSGLTGTYINIQKNDGSWSNNINTTTSGTQTSMTYTSEPNAKYYFRFLAYNDVAQANYYGYAGPVYTTPLPPDGYGLKFDTMIRLSASAGLGKYVVNYIWQYSADNGSTYTTLGTSSGSMTHTPDVENPLYRVASINADGLQSAWTNVVPTNSRQLFIRIPDGSSYQGIYVWKDE